MSTSYSLSTSESVQLRVQCVRIRDGIESVSTPSAIQFATPSLAVISRKKTLEVTEQGMLAIRAQDISNVQWIQYHILSDKHYAFVILVGFNFSFESYELQYEVDVASSTYHANRETECYFVVKTFCILVIKLLN